MWRTVEGWGWFVAKVATCTCTLFREPSSCGGQGTRSSVAKVGLYGFQYMSETWNQCPCKEGNTSDAEAAGSPSEAFSMMCRTKQPSPSLRFSTAEEQCLFRLPRMESRICSSCLPSPWHTQCPASWHLPPVGWTPLLPLLFQCVAQVGGPAARCPCGCLGSSVVGYVRHFKTGGLSIGYW